MENIETVYTITLNPGIAIAMLVGILLMCGALIHALRSGRLSSDVLATGTAMLEGVHDAAEALAKATGNPAITAASYIFKATAEAAHAAEQLHRTGEIGAEERNAKAKEIAESLLELAGIEVTEDRKAAIAVLLEAECDAMGHSVIGGVVLEAKDGVPAEEIDAAIIQEEEIADAAEIMEPKEAAE